MRVLWYAPGDQIVMVDTLAKSRARLDCVSWRGRRVALGAMSSLELAYVLLLLDGLAECLLFLPLEQSQSVQANYLEELRIDIVLGRDTAQLSDIVDGSSSTFRVVDPGDAIAPLETQWILPTSGTTGTPKLICHTLATLTRSMTRRDLGGEFIWGSLYHPRRFAGMQVFLQSLLAGTPLVLDDEVEVSREYLLRLSRVGCNALSATPSMWRKLAMCPGFETLPLRQITLGGEMADQPVLDLLRRCFPAARLVHIYASTEAGVGFSVTDGLAGFPVAYLDGAPGKVGMKVDTSGRLWFRPVGEAPKEIGDSATPTPTPTDGWIDSGDLVKIVGGRIHFLGRASGSINVGGNKVMPEEVEAVIKEVPGVAFAIVKGRKNALMGNLVEAHVATRDDLVLDDQFKRIITDHCRSRLDSYKVPAFVKPMDQIELNAVGKISRKEAA